ncbi:cation-translocating P-type ATPase [Alkaliphilus pronyensis]|uniref:Cd(2+)-exporting ATPase n=1 Tax=Alkaliphilus pronyensis TaxID=1482732 RepID=A0A6I0FD31_9FIRM|nr:cation-translocating P-type ATPase [Alkaliphilus pronyensis]KAB3531766.1 cation-translocating P-type ATPase [Alkaliphilus pronyensis]
MKQFYKEHKQDFRIAAVTAILILLSITKILPTILTIDTVLIAAIIGGYPIYLGAISALIFQRKTKIGLLVSIAMVAAIAIGEYLAAAEVALIMIIGELLETYSVRKSAKALENLLHIVPTEARKVASIQDSAETIIPSKEIKVNDLLLVKPGERIPADGKVIAGTTYVDESPLTGESKSIEKYLGESVYGGSLNQSQAIYVQVDKVGDDSLIGRVLQLVKKAQEEKAPIQRLIDRVAGWFVPMSIMIAGLVFLFTQDVVRAVTVLIVFCPCGMLLSTPTAVMTGVGRGAQLGVLIKGAPALEAISKINTIIFDKTGTLTNGKPEVVDISLIDLDWDRPRLLQLAASLEGLSEHHIAKAITRAAKNEGISWQLASEWKSIVGIGIEGTVNGKKAYIGNKSVLKYLNMDLHKVITDKQKHCNDQGHTTIFIVYNQKLIGMVAIDDPIREKAIATIRNLKSKYIKDIRIATGDNEYVAKRIANELEIDQVYASLLPDEKLEIVKQLQTNGKRVLMIGDGINDAPALMQADVGVAMGKTGTDVAIEAADIALLSDAIEKIPLALQLSKRTVSTIKINLWLANGINVFALIAAAYGWIGPVMAAIIHNFGAIIVVLNSLGLYRFHRQQDFDYNSVETEMVIEKAHS